MDLSFDSKYIQKEFETNSQYAEWFGYYNFDVIRDDKLLCNRGDFEGRAIGPDDQVELGWYDLSTGDWHHIDMTDSFNWQQGASLQWLPGKGNENKVVYNKSDRNHYYSVIADIQTGEKRIIDYPVYSITNDGKKAIALNYERIYWTIAYHYQPVVNKSLNVRVADGDGIFQVDLESGEVKLIIGLKDVVALDAPDDFSEARHWCEHIMLNKNSTRIAFLHRFSYGGTSRNTRICIADIDGKNLQVIPGWRTRDWSHMGWINDDSFVIYSIQRNALQLAYIKQCNKSGEKPSLSLRLKRFLKNKMPQAIVSRVRQTNKCYELYAFENGLFQLTKEIKKDFFSIDGHPSFFPNEEIMLTDTYPDENGYQSLILYSLRTEKALIIGKFKAPLRGTPASCDLHPKISDNGKRIALDSAYSGKHRMIVFKLNWEQILEALE